MSSLDNLTNDQTLTIPERGRGLDVSGNARVSTTENIKDPNFGQIDGHHDEINPSASTDFVVKPYNKCVRNDIQIPAYTKTRDSWERAINNSTLRVTDEMLKSGNIQGNGVARFDANRYPVGARCYTMNPQKHKR